MPKSAKAISFKSFIKTHIIECVLKLLETKFTSEEDYTNMLFPKKNGDLNTPITYSDYINKTTKNKINPIQISPDICFLFNILCDRLKEKLDENQHIITNINIIKQLLEQNDLLITGLYIADTNASYNLDHYKIESLEAFLSSTKIIKIGHTQMAILFNKFINLICRYIVAEIKATHKIFTLDLNKFELIIRIAEEFFFINNITLLINDIIPIVYREKADSKIIKDEKKMAKKIAKDSEPAASDDANDADDADDANDADDADDPAASDAVSELAASDDEPTASDCADSISTASTVKNGNNNPFEKRLYPKDDDDDNDTIPSEDEEGDGEDDASDDDEYLDEL